MRWGLIGASNIASQCMIAAIRAQHGHEVVSVLSSDKKRGKDYAKKHHIAQSSTSLDDLLQHHNVDVVYISTTNDKHYEQGIAAIKAGKHVVCEKPLAMQLSAAVDMVTQARRAKIVFATNHHLRNAGSHIKIKELIDAGEIGEVLSLRFFHAIKLPQSLCGWRVNSAAAGGGVIFDILVHDADTLRFYLDEDPLTITSRSNACKHNQGIEDNSMSIMTMPSGILVQVHESYSHPFAGNGVEVHGSKGSIIARGIMTQKPIGEIILHNKIGRNIIPFNDHDLYTYSMRLFADALAGKGRPSADGDDGIKSLAVALAAKESVSLGQTVTIDYGIEG